MEQWLSVLSHDCFKFGNGINRKAARAIIPIAKFGGTEFLEYYYKDTAIPLC